MPYSFAAWWASDDAGQAYLRSGNADGSKPQLVMLVPTISCGCEAPRRKEKLVAAINCGGRPLVCLFALMPTVACFLCVPVEDTGGRTEFSFDAEGLERGQGLLIQRLRAQTIVEDRPRGRRGRHEKAKSVGRRYPPPGNNRGLPLPYGATTLGQCVLDHQNRRPDAGRHASGIVVAALPVRGRRHLPPRGAAAAGRDAGLQASPMPTARLLRAPHRVVPRTRCRRIAGKPSSRRNL